MSFVPFSTAYERARTEIVAKLLKIISKSGETDAFSGQYLRRRSVCGNISMLLPLHDYPNIAVVVDLALFAESPHSAIAYSAIAYTAIGFSAVAFRAIDSVQLSSRSFFFGKSTHAFCKTQASDAGSCR